MRILAKSVRLILAAFAWVLFAIWWTRVTRPSWTPRIEITRALWVIVLVAAAFIAFSVLWIRHNMRLAQKGRRGKVSNYVFFANAKDALGRALVFEFERAVAAPSMIVLIEAQQKIFRLPPAAAGDMAGAD